MSFDCQVLIMWFKIPLGGSTDTSGLIPARQKTFATFFVDSSESKDFNLNHEPTQITMNTLSHQPNSQSYFQQSNEKYSSIVLQSDLCIPVWFNLYMSNALCWSSANSYLKNITEKRANKMQKRNFSLFFRLHLVWLIVGRICSLLIF